MNNNARLFHDTRKRILRDERLIHLTQEAIGRTRVIDEGFVSVKAPFFPDSRICFEGALTLVSAYRFVDAGKKTAVLNFANPVEPGGGVLRGANAQEEYLCRASNLYACLTSPNAESYYRIHNQLMSNRSSGRTFLGSDRIVYSPGITFFREDTAHGELGRADSTVQEYTDRWRTIDVITCAAPYFSSRDQALLEEGLYEVFVSRIRNILESAIEHEIESLVLGAFGCGAFNNPPGLVAQAFQDVLLEERYLHAFVDVAFAVKRGARPSENTEVFGRAFERFPPE